MVGEVATSLFRFVVVALLECQFHITGWYSIFSVHRISSIRRAERVETIHPLVALPTDCD
jgi:hypothetical protein